MTTPNEQAQHLLSELGIGRIIQVDDANVEHVRFEHIWDKCAALTADDWETLDVRVDGMPYDLLHETVEAHWRSLDDEEQRGFAERALAACGALGESTLNADNLFQASFKGLFPDASLECWSRDQWKNHRDEVIEEAHNRTTLVLFDLHFEREYTGNRAGVQLLEEVKDQTHLFFGILSHDPTIADEPRAWAEISVEANVPKDRFVVLSKSRIREDDASLLIEGFLRMMLAQDINLLKETCERILESSVRDATAEIGEISVYDFDQAIFRSSNIEGVWEGDTYFRLFNATVRSNAQTSMHSSTELRDLITAIRRKFWYDGNDKVDPAVVRTAWKLRRQELYEDLAFVNNHCLPISNGDIFGVTTGTGNDIRTMVLVGQPCDLAVRRKGTRAFEADDLGRMAIWLELGTCTSKKAISLPMFELPYYSENDASAKKYVHVGRVHYVRLAALDLCALNNDGCASLPLDTNVDQPLLLPGWKERVGLLQRVWKAPLSRLSNVVELTEDNRETLMAGLIPPPCQSVDVSVTLEGAAEHRVLKLGIKRVGRIAPELSTALLGAVAAYMSRPASAHDLAREK